MPITDEGKLDDAVESETDKILKLPGKVKSVRVSSMRVNIHVKQATSPLRLLLV